MSLPDLARRDFLKAGLAAAADCLGAAEPLFKISLAEWSLNGSIRSGALDPVDFAVSAKNDYDIDAVEYVNQLFASNERAYVREMKSRADAAGVRSLLIMCDKLDPLPSGNQRERIKAVEGHYAWIETARFLGCHSIRVNAQGGTGSIRKLKSLLERLQEELA